MVTVFSLIVASLDWLSDRLQRQFILLRTTERGTAKCEYVLLASLLSTAIVASTNPLSSAIESELGTFHAAISNRTSGSPTGFVNNGNWMTTRDLNKHGLPSGNFGSGEDGSASKNNWMIAQNDGGHSTGSTPGIGGNALHVGPRNLDDSNPPGGNSGDDGSDGSSGGGNSNGGSGTGGHEGGRNDGIHGGNPGNGTTLVP